MKKLICSILFFLPGLMFAQNRFKVKATLENIENKKVRLIYKVNGRNFYDTLTANKHNSMVWEGTLDEPQLARLEVLDSSLNLKAGQAVAPAPFLSFILDNANISITGSAKKVYAAQVSSKNVEVSAYERFHQTELPVTEQVWALQKEQNRKLLAKDTAGVGDLKNKVSALYKENKQLSRQFIDANPKAFASIIMLQNMFATMPVDEMVERFGKLDAKHLSSNAGKTLSEKIESNKNTSIGRPVVAFSQTGVDGNLVDIAALKGKVILVDFWGSWCVPCRKSHPALKGLYEKYKSRGFEIVGVANEAVSIGKSPEQQDLSWRKAITEDGLKWLNVIYKPEIMDIVKAYDIMVYPTKFLIDQNGKFIMKLMGSSEEIHKSLEKKLEELMPQ